MMPARTSSWDLTEGAMGLFIQRVLLADEYSFPAYELNIRRGSGAAGYSISQYRHVPSENLPVAPLSLLKIIDLHFSL
jgi:hypothetical protein